MDFKSKVEKIRELDKESRKLQREIVAEIESQLPDLFLNNGFELDPRKVKEGMIGYDRSFYDPYNRMSIIYGPIDKNGINFSVVTLASISLPIESKNELTRMNLE